MKKTTRTITLEQGAQVGDALDRLDLWALLDDMLDESTTADERRAMTVAINAHYPKGCWTTDVDEAWNWLRLHGDEWGYRAGLVARGKARDIPLGLALWRREVREAKDDLAAIREASPRWPFEPLPRGVFTGMTKRVHYFSGRVPYASERRRGLAAHSAGLLAARAERDLELLRQLREAEGAARRAQEAVERHRRYRQLDEQVLRDGNF